MRTCTPLDLGVRQQSIADVARFMRRGEDLEVLGLVHEQNAEVLLKELALLSERHERSILRIVFTDESVTKRTSSTCVGKTLQRPPPLMRIFRPPSRVLSSSTTSAPARAAKMAAMEPAAPAPMTMTFT